MVYSEGELVIPALEVINEYDHGINTSTLIKELTDRLNPTGHDAEIISGRKDTYFSQKVRNLKSHDTLVKEELATYSDGIWKITDRGSKIIEGIEDDRKRTVKENLKEQGIDVEKIPEKDLSRIIIEEGTAEVKTQKQRKRSSKLREIAVAHFKKESGGKLICEVCNFNFFEKYGKLGENFIEIHHKEPISEKDIEGDKKTLDKALEKVSPLCSNCHRMIHRKKAEMLSIEDLRNYIDNG